MASGISGPSDALHPDMLSSTQSSSNLLRGEESATGSRSPRRRRNFRHGNRAAPSIPDVFDGGSPADVPRPPPPSFAPFVSLKSSDDTRLSDRCVFDVYKDIVRICDGAPKKVVPQEDGSLLVEARSAGQSSALLAASSIGGATVQVGKHPTLNQTQGIIFHRRLLPYTEERLCLELKSQGVVGVRRILSKDRKPTPNLVLTFDSLTLPAEILAGYLLCSVRLYIPAPLRCTKCQIYGHTKRHCRHDSICADCGLPHGDGPCSRDPQCANCHGAHPAYSKLCPRYKMEQEVLLLRTRDRISFREARRLVGQRFSPNNFANVARRSAAAGSSTGGGRANGGSAPSGSAPSRLSGANSVPLGSRNVSPGQSEEPVTSPIGDAGPSSSSSSESSMDVDAAGGRGSKRRHSRGSDMAEDGIPAKQVSRSRSSESSESDTVSPAGGNVPVPFPMVNATSSMPPNMPDHLPPSAPVKAPSRPGKQSSSLGRSSQPRLTSPSVGATSRSGPQSQSIGRGTSVKTDASAGRPWRGGVGSGKPVGRLSSSSPPQSTTTSAGRTSKGNVGSGSAVGRTHSTSPNSQSKTPVPPKTSAGSSRDLVSRSQSISTVVNGR